MSIFGFGKKKEEIESCCKEKKDSKMKDLNEMNDEKEAFVKVLGSGCTKCNQLEEAAKEALKIMGMDTTIEHVTDFAQIAAYGVMTTPALVVDNKVVSYGKVLKTQDVVLILKQIQK